MKEKGKGAMELEREKLSCYAAIHFTAHGVEARPKDRLGRGYLCGMIGGRERGWRTESTIEEVSEKDAVGTTRKCE